MIDRGPIDAWLAACRRAWTTDERDQVAALFTPDVRYFTAPDREPMEGVDAVLSWWLEMKESALPWTFAPEVIAQDGGLYVVKAVTHYPQGEGEDRGTAETFSNLWLVTLAADGRASEFVEYFMLAE